VKRAAVTLIAVLAFALPATAAAATFSGSADPSGTVSFRLTRVDGATKVKNFTAHKLPIDCSEGSFTASGKLTFGVSVQGKRFSASAGDGSGSTFVLHGKLTHRRKRARGTIRIHGSSVPTDDGSRHHDCDTGALAFHAHRG
jgi:hypothetical protein